jgi:hypothetical protein
VLLARGGIFSGVYLLAHFGKDLIILC